MGKKTNKSHQALTTSESLRRHSNTLERHIPHHQRVKIKKTLEKQQFNLSFSTQEMAGDVLREVKKEIELSKQ